MQIHETEIQLPYKQGVTGSNPVGPTSSKKSALINADFFITKNEPKLAFGEVEVIKNTAALADEDFSFAVAVSQGICNPVGPTS